MGFEGALIPSRCKILLVLQEGLGCLGLGAVIAGAGGVPGAVFVLGDFGCHGREITRANQPAKRKSRCDGGDACSVGKSRTHQARS